MPVVDKARYKSRKKKYHLNQCLGACAPDLQFIYVLVGWEGSVADGIVLQSDFDMNNGLKVARG